FSSAYPTQFDAFLSQFFDRVVNIQKWQQLKHEATSMMKQIENLEVSKRFTNLSYLVFESISYTCICKWLRKLLGESLELCTIEELQEIEQKLERSVNCI
ncbi:MADS-box protein SOC1-like, partial [Rosa chinensis]|uniref:MADS-box protein SOC1-like n=1 Tax=Rosa chinensis TaxID=74649 RepID=UPI000D08C474